jgi:fructokinase
MKTKYTSPQAGMLIGIDLGGTKIEGLALDTEGRELMRQRVATPRDYDGTVAALVALVESLETETGLRGSVGVGIPGTVRAATGLVKNANSIWLNGRPLPLDLSRAMGREVRLANDANCLAVSEATDGAARGRKVVFGVILGTGCGGGVALDGAVHSGPNGVGGEWGHNPLPWPNAAETLGPDCYCGQKGCIETWVSGTGIAREFEVVTGRRMTTAQIAAAAEQGDAEAGAALDRLEDRLARALAGVVNILDPDVFVLGGGVSRIERIYRNLPPLIRGWTFGGDFDTPIVPAQFGDSSGVRGAAWLWNARAAKCEGKGSATTQADSEG